MSFTSHIAISRSHKSHIALCRASNESNGVFVVGTDNSDMYKYLQGQLLWSHAEGMFVAMDQKENIYTADGDTIYKFDKSRESGIILVQATLQDSGDGDDARNFEHLVINNEGYFCVRITRTNIVQGGSIASGSLGVFDPQGNKLWEVDDQADQFSWNALCCDKNENLLTIGAKTRFAPVGAYLTKRSVVDGTLLDSLVLEESTTGFARAGEKSCVLSKDGETMFVALQKTDSSLFVIGISTSSLSLSQSLLVAAESEVGHYSLDIDSDGFLYLGVKTGFGVHIGDIFKISPDLSSKEVFYPNESGIFSLAVDTLSNVYFLYQNNGYKIRKINKTGEVVFTESLPVNDVGINIAVHPGRKALI